MAGLDDNVDEAVDRVMGEDDADRRDAHRRPIGGAGPPGEIGGDALRRQREGFARRRPEQICRTGGDHAIFPGEKLVGEDFRIDMPPSFNQQPSENHRLIGVVGHAACRHAAADGIVFRAGLEVAQNAVALGDQIARQVLGRHAQCVADR